MSAPYNRGEYFRNGYLSKGSSVEEDHSKLSDDETRISRELDIDDIGGAVEGEPRHAKGPNVASAVSLMNARKRKGSSRRNINHEKDIRPPKQEPAKK